MGIKVFLSSTSEDLADDCRANACAAIEMCNAKAITMETWDTDYQPALEVCRKKIRDESSHYLGIFAYRRGWVPQGLSKSVTEMEFDWSIEYKKPMVIFVPNHTSLFALELKCRSKEQSQEDQAAQELFLKKVSTRGTYQPFKDLADLGMRIVRKIMMWSQGGGLRDIARKTGGKPMDNRKGLDSRITENDILELGRKTQFRQFTDSLDKILECDFPTTVGYLVYGKPGFGHAEMIKRLYSKIEADSNVGVKSISLSIGPLWRQNSLTEMLQIIGEQIQVNLGPPSIKDLASRLNELLADNDVILTIRNIQRLEGSIKGFKEHFWQPLVEALGDGFENKFIALLSFEGTIEKEHESTLCDPSNMDDFQGHSIIVLDELKEFTQGELKSWLRKWYSQDDAQTLSETLIAESKEGNPQLLYYKLPRGAGDLYAEALL